MAYPVVEQVATSTDTDRSGTTFNMNLPAGITAGETLIGCVASRDGTDSVIFPAGWTELWTDFETSGDDLTGAIWIKKADGTETGTIAVTVTADEASGLIYRISGAADPEIETPVVVSRGSTSAGIDTGGFETSSSLNDHLLLGSEFGRYDRYLGIATLFFTDTIVAYDEYPDNYSNFTNAGSGGGGFEVGVISGHRDIQSIGEFWSRWRVNWTANQQRYVTGLVVYPAQRYVPPSTFPYINRAALSQDTQRSASTTFDLILPPAEPGDIIIGVTATHDADVNTVTWPSDWTELYDATDSGGNSDLNSSCAWKIADGSEGRTVRLTVDANPTCGVAFTVKNIPDPDPTYTDAFTYNMVEGNNQAVNAGSQVPSAGSDNYLWVMVAAVEDDYADYADFPTDYDGRFCVKGDWSIDTNDTMLIVLHSNDETARTQLTTDNIGLGDSKAWIATQFVFYPGSFDPGDWWYLNWRHKGRNGFM